jgi:ectoine hydroxylase-related dioxygenase (phytanoyl-CoA dioxygenase family)
VETGLSESDIENYERDGFLHLKNIIKPEEIDALRQAVMAQVKNVGNTRTGYDFESIANQVWGGEDMVETHAADRFEVEYYKAMIQSDKNARPMRDTKTQEDDGENGMFFYDAGGWRAYKGIREAALDSALPQVCAKLMDSEYINFWDDTTFVKTPNTTQRTAFHQDYTYFQITGKKCCIAWIPLDETTKENSTMQYVRGSHKWGKSFAPNVFISQTTIFDAEDQKLPDIEGNSDDFDIVTVDAKPGDVIIHNVMTVHGSSGNLSHDKGRRAISFRYCGDDVRYFDRPGALEQPNIAVNLPDGAPLYSKDYPLVWPRPYPSAKLAPFFEGMPYDR